MSGASVAAAASGANGTPVGGNVATGTITWGGNGKNTLTGAGATGPANWFFPGSASVGDGFWLQVNRTGGTGGVNFTQTSGVWTNIGSAGLTTAAVGAAGSATGTYNIARDSAGVNIVATGNLSCNNTI